MRTETLVQGLCLCTSSPSASGAAPPERVTTPAAEAAVCAEVKDDFSESQAFGSCRALACASLVNKAFRKCCRLEMRTTQSVYESVFESVYEGVYERVFESGYESGYDSV